jgi:hypothetical protein
MPNSALRGTGTTLVEFDRDSAPKRRLHFGHFGRLKHFHAIDEMGQVWDLKDKLIEERYVDVMEEWGIDSGQEFL